MRIGLAALVLGIGIGVGFVASSLGVETPVQAQAIVPEARFMLGPQERVHIQGSTGSPSTMFIHFMLDRRTKDCFLVTTGTTGLFTAVTPVQSAACPGSRISRPSGAWAC